MNDFLSKWLFFIPARLIRGENFIKCIKEVRRVESFSVDELMKFQIQKLQNLLNERNNIPYLQKNTESHNSKYTISALEDLAIFPVADKTYLIDNLEEFRSQKVSLLSSRSTSGSTGQPFKFYRDRFSLAYMDAVMYNAYSWHGIKTGERQARFWGMPFDAKKKREAILKDFLMNRVRLSAFDISNENFEKYYRKIYKFRPGYFYGYASLIYEFACFCRERGYSFHNFKIKAIVVTGEKLVSSQKTVIEDVFATKVVQEYGCSEIGVIGFECSHGKMHVMAPNVIVDVVKDGHSVLDEQGEIVITELNAKSFPFVRYKIGDIGAIRSEQCSCGIKWPVIEITEGRIDDYIITPEGNKVYDAVLAYTFNGYKKYIKMFKAVQRKNGDLEIKVVVTNECDDNVLGRCSEELRQRITPDISIRFSKVRNIEREKSGKLRYFVSEID